MLVVGSAFSVCIIGIASRSLHKLYLMEVIMALNLVPFIFINQYIVLYKKYTENASWFILPFCPVFIVHLIAVLPKVIDTV